MQVNHSVVFPSFFSGRVGELSAARVSLEGAEVAPGTLTTLWELTNPEPPIPRQELSQEIARSELAVPFDWMWTNFSFASEVRDEEQGRQSTKVGCECVAHIMQTLTDQDAEATVVSIDGSGRAI